MRRLSLTEYARRDYDPVHPDLGRALDSTGLVRATQSLDGRLRLTAHSVVGVARVTAAGETVELRVRPKMPVARLIWLLGYARDPRGWHDEPVGLSAERDLVPAVAVAFAATAERALAAEVLHGYRSTDEALPLLRGRLREADQLRGRLGLAPPLEVRFDEYTSDIVENRILVAAIRRLHRLPGVPAATRGRLHRLALALADVPPLTAGMPVPATPSNRLTARYQPALRLARLILADSSVEQPAGSVVANGFGFDLNRVFEDWLTTMLREVIEPAYGGRVTGQYSIHLDQDRQMRIRPDITWWQGQHCRAVVDAKYKAPSATTGPPADVYQMLAYCTRLGLNHGHLVYAGTGRSTEHLLTGSGVRIHVHQVDLSAPLDVVRAQVAQVADTAAAFGPGPIG